MTELHDITQAQTAETSASAQIVEHVARRRPRTSTVIAAVVLVAGIAIVLYPTASDWWNNYHQSRAIADYVQAVENTDEATLEKMLADARDYNKRLATKSNRYNMTDAEKAEYESLLDLTGTGIMGYIQINCIGVDYPIYHGLEENVLQIAVGHFEGTSLPVGGETTHAAISGHRGLPRARLLTDLDKMVEGDTFTVTVLNQTITYEVDQIRIVLPEDLSDLEIVEGEDYFTLITCTPYGVNSHRLLVRGRRIDNIIGASAVTADAVQIPRHIAMLAVGVPILFLFLLGMLVYYRTRSAVSRETAADALRQKVRNGAHSRKNNSGNDESK